jgi:hypothetical protein
MHASLPALKIALPEGWIDQSMALFLMPPPPRDPRSMQPHTDVSPGNITVTWLTTTAAASAVLANKLEAMRSSEGFLLETPAAADGDVSWATTSAGQAQRLFQVHAVRRVGDLVVSVVGSAMGPTLNDVRRATLAAAQSLTA